MRDHQPKSAQFTINCKSLYLLSFLFFASNNGQAQMSDAESIQAQKGNEESLFTKFFSEPTLTDTSGNNKKKNIIKIDGFIQVHSRSQFDTNGDSVTDPLGFRLLRARLIARGDVNNFTSYELEIDPRSPEITGVVRDAYIELHLLNKPDIIQDLRIGQQKIQFGWENRQSSTEMYFVNRAEMSDAVSRGENLRDVGLGLLGKIPLNANVRIENDITFTNGTRSNPQGPFDFNPKKALWGRIGVRYKTPKIELNLGGSFGYGGLRFLGDSIEIPDDDVFVDFKRIGADVGVEMKNFFFVSEFGKGTDMAADTLYDDPIGALAILAIKTKWDIGPSIRYDVFQDEWKRVTVGAYYGKPKDRLRFLINYEFRGQITDILPYRHDDRLYVQAQVRF
ncbi:MAG: porin [Chitinophagales bacterium]